MVQAFVNEINIIQSQILGHVVKVITAETHDLFFTAKIVDSNLLSRYFF